jgi:hypothetical protein
MVLKSTKMSWTTPDTWEPTSTRRSGSSAPVAVTVSTTSPREILA